MPPRRRFVSCGSHKEDTCAQHDGSRPWQGPLRFAPSRRRHRPSRRRPTRSSRRSRSTRPLVSRSTWSSFPTAASCTPSARARSGCTTRTTGLKTLAAKLDVYSHDEEGLQSIAIDPNFAQNGWIYLYYSPPLNTPVDNPATPTVNEGDAPFFGTPADFAPFKGYIQLSRFQWTGRLDRSRLRAEDPPGAGRSRHLLPRRGRHRLRRERQSAALDRRRHEPVPVRRLHADRRASESQPGIRRPAHVGEHERPGAARSCASR